MPNVHCLLQELFSRSPRSKDPIGALFRCCQTFQKIKQYLCKLGPPCGISKTNYPSHIVSADLCTSARCLKEGVHSTVNLKRRLSPPFLMVFLKSLTGTWDEKPLLATLYVDTLGHHCGFIEKGKTLEGTLERTSTCENSCTRGIVIALVGCLAAAIA